MSIASEVEASAAAARGEIPPNRRGSPAPAVAAKRRGWLALPVAIAVALVVHFFASHGALPLPTRAWNFFLGGALALSLILAVLQVPFPRVRAWLAETGPILAAAFLLLALWETLTDGVRLIEPALYFPSPPTVLASMLDDRHLLFDSTWHSLALLLSGYGVGVLCGVVTGVIVGWFGPARYWGMPLLKVIGPIPATAWVPLAMILTPSRLHGLSAVFLIALAVWFPVSMLTISGVANTRASYLDVARTLGAKSSYLVFRVAVPAAMPNIFLGLFMGLGASFLTLVVAENVGVTSGLGWYFNWAQTNAEYGKLYGAIVIMAAFFSTIMTLLFKVRDRVLVWQKGQLKW
ncbi:MAG TPA: ABC transporter permease subunit [Chthoniobacteraceae bacterium]|jgi:NitT/TauT family transport system permease protein|nr:ABC transporter permease subunit [Chthoniobacteraceae bacterium]